MKKYPALTKAGFVLPGGMSMSSFTPSSAGGYEGAAGGRRMGGWAPANWGPNLSVEASAASMRDRARDAMRNNPWAKNALESYAANVVGRGIKPRWMLEDKALKQEIHELFNDWVMEADADGMFDFYGLQTLVMKTLFQSGECLIRFRSRRISDGLSVPLQLQILEPDVLSDINDGTLSNGNIVRAGIEFNAIGQRVAYWMYKAHPNDGLWQRNSLNVVRVPASQVLHVYRVDRPGQLRGVPWLAPVLVRMYLLDLYEDAELDRKKTAALFAAFVKSNQSDSSSIVGFGSADNKDDMDRPYAELEPAIIQYLLPGEDVTFSEPADVGGTYEVWIKQQLRAIAAGIGVTYEQLTGDLRGVNYSSIRAGLVEFRRKAQQIQNNVMIFQLCRKVADVWLAFAVASGALKIKDFATNRRIYKRIQWQPDGWDWVDPSKDIKAAKDEVLAGFTSRERVVAERGGDIEIIDRENAESVEREEELGIDYDTTVRAGRAAPPPTEPTDPPPDEEKEENTDPDENKEEEEEEEENEDTREEENE